LIERRVSCPVSSLLATVYSEHNGLNLWRWLQEPILRLLKLQLQRQVVNRIRRIESRKRFVSICSWL
jgi:phage baseplate assembly protein W